MDDNRNVILLYKLLCQINFGFGIYFVSFDSKQNLAFSGFLFISILNLSYRVKVNHNLIIYAITSISL